MMTIQTPSWGSELRNFYWHLRLVRGYDQAAKRYWYRRIRAERDRLEAAGMDPELVRLFCRHMSNPRRPEALERFCRYSHGVTANAATSTREGSPGGLSDQYLARHPARQGQPVMPLSQLYPL